MLNLIFHMIFTSVIICPSNSLKVNLEGTLSLGKGVMSSLSELFGKPYPNGRRFMGPIADEDSITDIVRTATLCRDLDFCLSSRKFIDEFIIVLSKSMETILSNSLKDRFKIFMFEEHLKHYLVVIRYILEETNIEITEKKETYYWMSTIKKICAKFQEMSSVVLSEDLQIDPIEIKKIKRALNHKIIIAIAMVELEYNRKLCIEHKFCITSYKITKSLKNLLEVLKDMPDEKVFKDIGKELWVAPEDLFIKLMNEVEVFLELTIDPQELM
ncbi:unnamed protein product, partial [Brenthis ino]